MSLVLPTLGKISVYFSNVWKKRVKIFQGLELTASGLAYFFQGLEKLMGAGSACFQGLEK